MSRDEWEAGDIVLPTAAVPAVRKALRDAANAYHERVLEVCLRLWSGPIAKTSSVRLYNERLEAAMRRENLEETLSNDVWDVMGDIVRAPYADWRTPAEQHPPAPSPRTPRASDVDKAAPRANTRTDAFGAGGEWRIRIDGAKLHYGCGEAGNAIERAHEHPVVAAMFSALRKVEWTRGSGGVFTGNDEYNQESRGAGSGGNYITAEFGPKGQDERAWSIGMSPDKYRAMLARQPKPPVRRW
jgi:hypothetical protein